MGDEMQYKQERTNRPGLLVCGTVLLIAVTVASLLLVQWPWVLLPQLLVGVVLLSLVRRQALSRQRNLAKLDEIRRSLDREKYRDRAIDRLKRGQRSTKQPDGLQQSRLSSIDNLLRRR